MGYWESDVARWEALAEAFSPSKAALVSFSDEVIGYDQLVKSGRQDVEVLFAGKRAYALRQASGRRKLLELAVSKFTPLIPKLDGDTNGRSEFVEAVARK